MPWNDENAFIPALLSHVESVALARHVDESGRKYSLRSHPRSMIRWITWNSYRILTSNAITGQMSPVHMTPTVPINDKIATNVSRETDPEMYHRRCTEPSKRQFSTGLVA